MSEESHMGWKLVQGVRRDLINFFKLYANTDSIRFEDFCKVWKEMNFSLIFSYRVSFIELLEFSEEILQIVKEYLFPVYEFYIRIAALYTLYGLYFKQPIKGAAKIRFTKTEWEEVYKLVEHSKEAKHYDVVFIFTKLYLNGAYTFSATVRPAGLERGFRKYFDKRSSLFSKAVDVELLYRPLISKKLVNSLIKLESLYCRKKSELLGSKNLIFIDGEFAESLQQTLRKYESLSQNEQNMKTKVPLNSETADNSVNEGQSSSSKVGIQTRSTRKRKRQESVDNKKSDKEISNKWNKFSKNFLDLMAKKKAEYYIQKLQTENNLSESGDKNPLLMGLCELEGYDSSEST